MRQLIGRVKTGLDTLSPEDRAEVQAAVTTVRRARNSVVSLGLPKVRPTLLDMRGGRGA